jgi:AAA family ATP:ADP antiporter
MLGFLIKICRFNFGDFDKEEFKKFLYMGGIFALIVGVYWALRPLKDSVFFQFVDNEHLPYAKIVSIIALLPIIILYTKALEHTSRERMLAIIPTIYGIATLFFAVLIFLVQNSENEISDMPFVVTIAVQILGYAWYLFVESFGSLVIALFWAFSTDTTDHASAKRGFPLVYALGQMGGIVFPYAITGMPHRLGHDTCFLALFTLGILTLAIVPLVRHFLRVTPKNLLVSFHGKNEKEEVKKHEPGFFEGLQLLVKHKYLIGIFGATFIYELIITIFDFNFKIAASTQYSGTALDNYLGIYASSVNAVSLACLLLGINNITRYLGVGVALAAMPIIVGLALFGFMTIHSLSFLFALMVGSKAINYALNGPALKQLYIPTTTDVRFKTQAWIETFGARASKGAGSFFNIVAGRAHYLLLSGMVGFPLLVLWFITAIFLGKKFKQAIDGKKVIC